MSSGVPRELLFEALITGNRSSAIGIVTSALDRGDCPREMLADVLWPMYHEVDARSREDRLSRLSQHMATRLLRVLVDRVASRLSVCSTRNRSVLLVSGPSEHDELGAQIAVDLLEAEGFTVVFAGGGVAEDEILGQVHETQPDVLASFCTGPHDLPAIRGVIDKLRGIAGAPDLQIAVGGGVFNRADELADEIGADLWAETPLELVEALVEEPDRRATPDQRTVGRGRRRSAA